MEESPDRVTINEKLGTDNIFGSKLRLRQMNHQWLDKAEVICPEPRRVMKTILDGSSTSLALAKDHLPVAVNQEDYCLEIMDIILGKDVFEDGLEPTQELAICRSSPPVRTNNPLIHDPQFVKHTASVAATSISSPLQRSAARTEWGSSPSCGVSFGAKPIVRIEGFTCGSSERHHDVVHAIA